MLFQSLFLGSAHLSYAPSRIHLLLTYPLAESTNSYYPHSLLDLPILVMAVPCSNSEKQCTTHTRPFPGHHAISKGWGHFFRYLQAPLTCIHCQSPDSTSCSSTLALNTFSWGSLSTPLPHYFACPQLLPHHTFLLNTRNVLGSGQSLTLRS